MACKSLKKKRRQISKHFIDENMMKTRTLLAISVFLLLIRTPAFAEDGYNLWLRYAPIENKKISEEYSTQISSIFHAGSSPTLNIAIRELSLGIKGLLGKEIVSAQKIQPGSILLLNSAHAEVSSDLRKKASELGTEGFLIESINLQGSRCIIVCGNTDIAILYGTFHLLRHLQQEQPIRDISVTSKPSIQNRILNHWDNLDRTIERGYAGFSLWDWHRLPDYIDPRYEDYARANASVGINGTVLTNVNANALVLTEPYLKKVKALADVFRPYGIKVYLTARFSAPIEIGHLPTADPLNERVAEWWRQKTAEIYKHIPDFGGFLVKANSEGQPGPQNYGRTHADGANVLARALQPFGGIVMWRAFVYSNEKADDRVKQAFDEFKPLDGKFDPNVLLQVKNGPLDFQPREPFHPLFGGMSKTPLMMEFQLTQEYLGFATHLVYLGTLFNETLRTDTYQKGEGSLVSKAIDGSLFGHSLSAIAGVANIGNDRNWCGHPFAQANWYVYGRTAWDIGATPRDVAVEWIRQTLTRDAESTSIISDMMMQSRETLVNYMTPLGLHHIMGYNHHYGPGPWIKDKQREDWTSVYYHKADGNGIGFNRTTSGSNALGQYHPLVAKQYSNLSDCPEEYLLWFHHVSWDHKMKSGHILWEEIVRKYFAGADEVLRLKSMWSSVSGKIDPETHEQVEQLLTIQHNEACWWRDACLLYFEKLSGKKIPPSFARPKNSLEYYQSLEFPYAPGIRPKW
jgi:alpha-glucuronidase